jgi:hypothetical protein
MLFCYVFHTLAGTHLHLLRSALQVHFTSCTATRQAHGSGLESADFPLRFFNGASEALWTGAEVWAGR